MFSLTEMPSMATLLTAYASLAGSMMFARSLINKFIPHQLQSYIYSKILNMLGLDSSTLIFVIEEFNGLTRNQVFEAAESFLSTSRITPSMQRFKISKAPRDKQISVTGTTKKDEEITDIFEGVQLAWKLVCSETQNSSNSPDPYRKEKKCYELSFHKKHKEMVQECYLPYILTKYMELKQEDKVVKLYSCGGGLPGDHDNHRGGRGSGVWGSIKLEHPSTFDTLAMEPELKNEIMEDLERFVKRREFYKKVGKAWKRGYLLYGPPGTGKSSLIAAMANYLKFDIYDLELANLQSNHCLRSLLASTKNRSIIVIEDIDCTVDLPTRNVVRYPYQEPKDPKVTLSGLLNFIDGLWSSCGDERIIIFTTNHKDKLDPALLRPGRMDMHIHMSYCTPKSFRVLASNYLSINDQHRLFGEIEELMQEIHITPAEVAGELMKSDDADISLDGLVKFMKRKKMEGNETKDDELGDKEATNQASEQQNHETDHDEEDMFI